MGHIENIEWHLKEIKKWEDLGDIEEEKKARENFMKYQEEYDTLITELLKEAVHEGCIECRECGIKIEIETEKCPECQWNNPVYGLI